MSTLIHKLTELYPTGIILGECRAIVGDMGLTISWVSRDGKEERVKLQANETVPILRISGNFLELGGYFPNPVIHSNFFKGFIKRKDN